MQCRYGLFGKEILIKLKPTVDEGMQSKLPTNL